MKLLIGLSLKPNYALLLFYIHIQNRYGTTKNGDFFPWRKTVFFHYFFKGGIFQSKGRTFATGSGLLKQKGDFPKQEYGTSQTGARLLKWTKDFPKQDQDFAGRV